MLHHHHGKIAFGALVVTAAVAAIVLAEAGSSTLALFSIPPLTTAPAGRQPHQNPTPHLAAPASGRFHLAAARKHGGFLSLGTAATIAAVDSIVGLSACIALAALLIKNRIDARERREYRLYEVHLSMHDDARPRDLHDMVEALGAAVREWPVSRLRYGQPFFAIELHYGPEQDGNEFLIALRCERDLVGALQSILANAYPDVRVGQTQGGEPTPLPGRLRSPGYLLRFRKERPFIYPIGTGEEDDASPTMEAIAQTQVMAGVPSSVRLQLTPTPLAMEGWARRKFRIHENRLARSEQRLIHRDAGLRSVLNQEEMRDAGRAIDTAMFWLEVQVAAPTAEHANRIAATVIARRGENRLQRRRMIARLNLYRRRFPDAYPPLLPTFGFGRFNSLASAAEVAHLLTLPTARMKAVPVRRLTVPRLPPPPEIARAVDRPVPTPDAERGNDAGGGSATARRTGRS